jgi:integrase/recombinase XerD
LRPVVGLLVIDLRGARKAADRDRGGRRAYQRALQHFFTANIRNRNTRIAVRQFCNSSTGARTEARSWSPSGQALSPHISSSSVRLSPSHRSSNTWRPFVSCSITWLPAAYAVEPAGVVRGPQYVVKRGKTPVLSAYQVRQLLDSNYVAELSGLRDRALIGVMVYTSVL